MVSVVRPLHAPRLPPPGPCGFLMLKNDAWLEIDRGLEARGPTTCTGDRAGVDHMTLMSHLLWRASHAFERCGWARPLHTAPS